MDVAPEGRIVPNVPGPRVVDLPAEEGGVVEPFLLTLRGGLRGVFGGFLLKTLTTLLFVLLEGFLVNICGLYNYNYKFYFILFYFDFYQSMMYCALRL